jgi:hypothetical protein
MLSGTVVLLAPVRRCVFCASACAALCASDVERMTPVRLLRRKIDPANGPAALPDVPRYPEPILRMAPTGIGA